MAGAASANDNATRMGCTSETQLLYMRHPGERRDDDLVFADGPSLYVQPKTAHATKQNVATAHVV